MPYAPTMYSLSRYLIVRRSHSQLLTNATTPLQTPIFKKKIDCFAEKSGALNTPQRQHIKIALPVVCGFFYRRTEGHLCNA